MIIQFKNESKLHLVPLRKRGCHDLSGRGINVETIPPQSKYAIHQIFSLPLLNDTDAYGQHLWVGGETFLGIKGILKGEVSVPDTKYRVLSTKSLVVSSRQKEVHSTEHSDLRQFFTLYCIPCTC
jgi:hypothetical protein